MPGAIVRQLTPEEEELHRKREELGAIRATLAERELELADFRAKLRSFEGRYLRQVGVLYAELDDWQAKIAELEAKLNPSSQTAQHAQEARERAAETHEAAHGEAAKAPDIQPSADMKSLYRKAARQVHPDFAKDAADLARRTRLMAQLNEAYSRGDAETIERILKSEHHSSDTIPGEGIGAELIRIIRQIAQAKKRIADIEQELSQLRASEIAKLQQDVELENQQGPDLLAELAASLSLRVRNAVKRFHALNRGMTAHGN